MAVLSRYGFVAYSRYFYFVILKLSIGIVNLIKLTDFNGIPHIYRHGKFKKYEKPTKRWLRKHGVCLYRPTETITKLF